MAELKATPEDAARDRSIFFYAKKSNLRAPPQENKQRSIAIRQKLDSVDPREFSARCGFPANDCTLS